MAALALLPITADAACRQALALGLDVSESVDAFEYRQQLDGLAMALQSPRVQEVLFRQPEAPIHILVYEWSGPNDQKGVVPWTAIDTVVTLGTVARRLQNHQRSEAAPTTAIGSAMLAGFDYLRERSYCWKRTLDLSGDGQTNTGPKPEDISDNRTPSGVVVNGLVIGSGNMRGDDERFADIKELSSYYRTRVIRGSDAFVEVALGFEDYAAAMERKLLREMAAIAIGNATQIDAGNGT